MAAADELALLIQSRYPLIAAETIEEHRFQRTLLQVAESLRVPFYEWSLTEGLHRIPALGAVYDTTEPLKALNLRIAWDQVVERGLDQGKRAHVLGPLGRRDQGSEKEWATTSGRELSSGTMSAASTAKS